MTLISQLVAIEALHVEYKQLTDFKTQLEALVAADVDGGDSRVLSITVSGATSFNYKITNNVDGASLQTFLEGIWNARLAAITTSLGDYLKSTQ